jgi:hypothetical protein
MQESFQKSIGGMKLVAIIIGACIACAAAIAFGMTAAAHFEKPGYIPPEVVAPAKGHCYSFELNCDNPIKHGASYYETGKYLAP